MVLLWGQYVVIHQTNTRINTKVNKSHILGFFSHQTIAHSLNQPILTRAIESSMVHAYLNCALGVSVHLIYPNELVIKRLLGRWVFNVIKLTSPNINMYLISIKDLLINSVSVYQAWSSFLPGHWWLERAGLGCFGLGQGKNKRVVILKMRTNVVNIVKEVVIEQLSSYLHDLKIFGDCSGCFPCKNAFTRGQRYHFSCVSMIKQPIHTNRHCPVSVFILVANIVTVARATPLSCPSPFNNV